MHILFSCLLLSCYFLPINYGYSQEHPVNKSGLHYRVVNFSVPEKENITDYQFEISEFTISDKGALQYELIFNDKAPQNHQIKTFATFGKNYSWKVKYYIGEKLIETSQEYFFSILNSKCTDTAQYRTRVLKNEVTNKDLLFFEDGLGALCNTNGEVLWYIPDIEGFRDHSYSLRDIKLTHDHTITFLVKDKNEAYEMDYDGNILWKGPNDGRVSGDTTETYHHQLTKLTNGHYMVLGIKEIERKMPHIDNPSLYDGDDNITKRGNDFYRKIITSTIIEYDKENNIIWSWKAADHLTDADLFTRKTTSGKIRSNTHMNCFWLDATNNYLYVGYRDINRIMKISYPSGNVVTQYGEDFVTDKTIYSPGLFFGHHNNSINSNGDILLFNNNIVQRNHTDSPLIASSSIVILEESKKTPELTLKWEFDCDFDSLSYDQSAAGGSVYELSDKNMLVSMGSVSRCFIVTPEKKIIWDALIESKTDQDKWMPVSNYRISPIESAEDFKSFIINTEN